MRTDLEGIQGTDTLAHITPRSILPRLSPAMSKPADYFARPWKPPVSTGIV
jgi:hypothetical protein